MKYFCLCFTMFFLLEACNTPDQKRKTDPEAETSVTLVIRTGETGSSAEIDNLVIRGENSVRNMFINARDQGLLTFEEKSFENLGSLVVSINGREQTGDKYWLYCINGNKANKGIQQQLVTDGDRIVWSLTAGEHPCD